MRYIADSSGYLQQVSFGANITCDGQECTLYSGTVPTGYSSLEDWYLQEGEKLYRWKIVSGNLTIDSSAAAPVDAAAVDYIVEQGEKRGWTYRIWASGVKECWISGVLEEKNTSSSGELWGFYYSSFAFYFPVTFTTPPTVVADGGSKGRLDFLRVANVNENYMGLYIMNLTGTTDPATVNYWVYAKGT